MTRAALHLKLTSDIAKQLAEHPDRPIQLTGAASITFWQEATTQVFEPLVFDFWSSAHRCSSERQLRELQNECRPVFREILLQIEFWDMHRFLKASAVFGLDAGFDVARQFLNQLHQEIRAAQNRAAMASKSSS